MSLDQQTKLFLEQVASKPTRPPDEIPLADFRAALQAFKALGFEHEHVARVENLVVPRSEGPDIPVRLYSPITGSRTPVIVWAHGGSWVRGDIGLFDTYFRVLANRSGCAIAAVGYRLAPETRFPGPVRDVYDAAAWLKREGTDLGLDTDRVAAGGESSGGNLAAAAVLLDAERGAVGFVHQTLIVPALDARCVSPSWTNFGTGYLLTREHVLWALEQYAPGVSPTHPLLSPLCAPHHAGLPQTLIMTAEFDPLRDDGERYAESLRNAGVQVELRRVEGLIHHSLMVPRVIDLGRRLVEDVGAALAADLGTTPVR
ncbi:alpha/beta hydrolase [Nocardia gipuzkoensis]|uniref:alpha/beta hydrolase n=1 Tax=Nocardia gipuzkoensis TaxID=2749991 RepID=UPI003EDF7837